jgi:hypothetical protein
MGVEDRLIKLAAFDVDGTLKDKDFLPESAAEALQKLQAAGVTLALCTGRSDFEVTPLREALNIDWTITCNGSLVAQNGERMFGISFDPTVIRQWRETAAKLEHGMLMYGASGMYMNRANDPLLKRVQEQISLIEPVVLRHDDSVPDIYQCIVFCREEEETAYLGDRRNDFYIHRWESWAVDFNPKGTNKSVGLRWLAAHLGVNPSEVAVFGDGMNDLEMFAFAGVRIAMGNAVADLKRIATHVTKPLHEDGVAYAVDRWILPQIER